MGVRDVRAGGEPVSRLGVLGAAAIDAMEAHPQADADDQVLILMRHRAAGDGERPGGEEHAMVHAGFAPGDEGADEVVELLLRHAEALCQLTGRAFRVIPAGSS